MYYSPNNTYIGFIIDYINLMIKYNNIKMY